MKTLLFNPAQRKFFPLILLLLVCSCRKDFNAVDGVNSGSDDFAVSAKTNILILLSDDVGYEIPTCDGGQSYSTPNIDMLAQQGKRFTQCHAGPMCCPSRLMLLTGKYNFRNYTEWNYMSTDNKTIGNMFKDAGYATVYAGKWQLDGGDTAIHTFGFSKYSVWQPFNVSASEEGNRYKGASIYQDGAYLPDNITRDKYSEDEYTAYLLNFIDSTKRVGKPFFAFYSLINCHAPFNPTPDDPEYQTWDSTKGSNKKFFPSMVKYHDKKIGEIINHLDSLGLLQNTMIFYFGDNGTNTSITSQFNGFSVQGGKGETNEPGTNVPLIVYQKGKVTPAVLNTLIDFTDFLPTLKSIAGIGRLTGYGTLDGVSFAPAIRLNVDSIRPYIYDAYAMHPENGVPFNRWTQNSSYKLYDTVPGPQAGQFVKIQKGKPDSAPIPDSLLNASERKLKNNMLKVLRKYNP